MPARPAPNSTSPPFSTTSLTPLAQLPAAPALLVPREHPGARFAPKHLRRPLLPQMPHHSLSLPSTHPAPNFRSGSRSRALLLAPHHCSIARVLASLAPSSSRSHRSHLRPRGPKHPRARSQRSGPRACLPARVRCLSARVLPQAPHARTGSANAAPVLRLTRPCPRAGAECSPAPKAPRRALSATRRVPRLPFVPASTPTLAPSRLRLTPAGRLRGTFRPALLSRCVHPALAPTGSASTPARPSRINSAHASSAAHRSAPPAVTPSRTTPTPFRLTPPLHSSMPACASSHRVPYARTDPAVALASRPPGTPGSARHPAAAPDSAPPPRRTRLGLFIATAVPSRYCRRAHDGLA